MRKEMPEIGWGDYQIIKTADPAILAIRYDWRNNSVFFVHNLAPTPREIEISLGLPAMKTATLVNVLSDDHSRPDARGKHRLLMEAYGYRWFRVGGLDYLLLRSNVEENEPASQKPRRPKKRGRRR
jgi:maltose alpha-D-glucosyltransferase/alpha-amylase